MNRKSSIQENYTMLVRNDKYENFKKYLSKKLPEVTIDENLLQSGETHCLCPIILSNCSAFSDTWKQLNEIQKLYF